MREGRAYPLPSAVLAPDPKPRPPYPALMSTDISTDDGVRLAFAADASAVRLMPEGVARPESADEVAEILRRASAARTPVTPAGAQTSYTCASTSDVGIVLSTRGMDRILDLDVAARTVR